MGRLFFIWLIARSLPIFLLGTAFGIMLTIMFPEVSEGYDTIFESLFNGAANVPEKVEKTIQFLDY